MLTRPPRPSGSRYWIWVSGTRTLPFATGSPSCLATRRRSSAAARLAVARAISRFISASMRMRSTTQPRASSLAFSAWAAR